MKKILSILGTINLIGTITTNLVACNTAQEYTKEELAKLKEKNNINTKYGILEWIEPQEKTFNNVDNKYYYVVWRGDKKLDWRIIKFKNSEKIERFHPKNLDKQNEINLNLNNYSQIPIDIDLAINANSVLCWKNDDGNYFKSVYRWNLDTQEPNSTIDDNGNVKFNEE
ncbi:MAG: lipoprotein [Spiroplasma phoeniceum]|nr:MAG: lipoprotein [Spiroplasma phoeniceum]UZQ32522.1 MAG: lipoprotein [Spiroplasma phoeniceum]